MKDVAPEVEERHPQLHLALSIISLLLILITAPIMMVVFLVYDFVLMLMGRTTIEKASSKKD